MKLPLEGVTVIDLTEVWAGPMGTTLLGDLGARVIKLESFPRASMTRIPGGPASRGYTNNDPTAPRPWNRAAIHNMANRNKYGVTLNFADSRAVQIFKKLVEISDVVAESFRGGTLDRMGIGYETLKSIKPEIILASIPGWGVEGPYEGFVSLGSALDAFSGHHYLRGYPDTDPSVTPVVQHTDAIGCLSLAFSVMVALHHRNKTGEGQWIDISQVESLLPHLSRPIMDHIMNGRPPRPLGNRDYFMAPHGCYRCLGEDDWVVITVSSDNEWEALCHTMGNPDWAKEKVFADPISRYDHQDELDAHIQEWTLQRDKLEIMHLLQGAGVPAEAVMDDADVYSDPHLEAREFFNTVDDPKIGEFRYPGFLWKSSKSAQDVRIPPAGLGEHNEYVYGTLLGMGAEEIRQLEADGIIGDELPPAS